MLLLPVLACIALARADYTEFFFAADGTCPGQSGVNCAPPYVCAYDAPTDKYYCCGGQSIQECWAWAPDCQGANSTDPSSAQQLCTTGDSEWCCLGQGYEYCTPLPGQINICIATQADTIANVSDKLLNKTFSSLSSANPAATTFAFDPSSLSSTTVSSATTSSSITTSFSTTTASSSSQSGAAPTDIAVGYGDKNGLSAGSVAGIIVGSLIVIAAVLAAAWFFLRKRRNRGWDNSVEKSTSQAVNRAAADGRNNAAVTPLKTGSLREEPVELENSVLRRELPAESNGMRIELSGDIRYY